MSDKTKLQFPFRRLIILLAGMFLIALGVIFSIEAELGTTTLSSLPQAAAVISGVSIGKTTIILNLLMILGQILVLRRRYHPAQLFQLPIAVAFGAMIDLAAKLIGDLSVQNLFQQWLLCFIGIILTAVGIGLEVMADLIPMPAEGLIMAICRVSPFKFSNVKIAMDVILVSLAAAVSYICLGRLEGIGLGTLAAALLVGLVMKVTNKLIDPIEKHFLSHKIEANELE